MSGTVGAAGTARASAAGCNRAYRSRPRRAPGHPHGGPGYITRRTPRRPGRGDTGLVRERTQVPMRAWLSQAVAFARSAEPRVPLSRRAIVTDIVIAAAGAGGVAARGAVQPSAGQPAAYVLDPATGQVFAQHVSPFVAVWKHAFPAILLTTVPLAVRRRFPLSAFVVHPARRAGGPAIRDGRHVPGDRVRRVLGGRLQPVPGCGAAQHAPCGPAGGRSATGTRPRRTCRRSRCAGAPGGLGLPGARRGHGSGGGASGGWPGS